MVENQYIAKLNILVMRFGGLNRIETYTMEILHKIQPVSKLLNWMEVKVINRS